MNSPAQELFEHPLTQALKEAGLRLSDASGYLERARFFGQVGFAIGEANEAQLGELRRGREALLGSIREKKTPDELCKSMLRAMDPLRQITGVATEPQEIDTNYKTKLARQWSQTDEGYAPHRVLGLSSDRNQMIAQLIGSDVYSAPTADSWERLDHVASTLSGPSPLESQDLGNLRLEPARIEEQLEARALSIMTRFGVGALRISGFPSIERVAASLDSLEVGLEEIAIGSKMPERAIGLGGDWIIHINAQMDSASGYCEAYSKVIALSPDNGWKTLAHEWFHGFDMESGRCLKIAEGSPTGLSELFDPKATGEAPSSSTLNFAELRKRLYNAKNPFITAAEAGVGDVTRALMSAIRHAPASETDTMASIAQEEKSISIQRISEGLFDRFYKNRVSSDKAAGARDAFENLASDVLDGHAGMPEIAKWRKEYLKEKADICKHYDAFVLAEKIARDSRIQARAAENTTEPSAMERFARLADEQLAAATGNKDWEGYSTSSLEMAARAYEGNCFLNTPKERRICLTDGGDNSMYWPVGNERGAHAELYHAFIAAGVRTLVEAGKLDRSVLDEFDPQAAPARQARFFTPEPVTDIRSKLLARRSAAEPPPALTRQAAAAI